MADLEAPPAQKLLDFGKLTGLKGDKLLLLAKRAEQAERYREMCHFMKAIVDQKFAGGASQDDEEVALKTEERNLLSVAYKNVVATQRQAWRAIEKEYDVWTGEPKAQSNNKDPLSPDLVLKFTEYIVEQLEAICTEVLDLLNNGPLKDKKKKLKDIDDKKTAEGEETVFFFKMCGDYYRYLCEVHTVPDAIKNKADKTDREEAKIKKSDLYKAKTQECYDDAMTVAKKVLAETHPTRLGLALNFSVCYYEIHDKKKAACSLAKEAFDAAIEKLDTLNDESYRDSTLIMQLLRDNLTLWTSEDGGRDEAPEQEDN